MQNIITIRYPLAAALLNLPKIAPQKNCCGFWVLSLKVELLGDAAAAPTGREADPTGNTIDSIRHEDHEKFELHGLIDFFELFRFVNV